MTAQQLKNSILQLAVQGKLVPQDQTDEPASVLLERIHTEKQRFIKEGKLKKEKTLPKITEDELPFDVPESWEWVRLGNAVTIKSSKRILKATMLVAGFLFIVQKKLATYRGEKISSPNISYHRGNMMTLKTGLAHREKAIYWLRP